MWRPPFTFILRVLGVQDAQLLKPRQLTERLHMRRYRFNFLVDNLLFRRVLEIPTINNDTESQCWELGGQIRNWGRHIPPSSRIT
jgi:hypothetical protein